MVVGCMDVIEISIYDFPSAIEVRTFSCVVVDIPDYLKPALFTFILLQISKFQRWMLMSQERNERKFKDSLILSSTNQLLEEEGI